MRDLGITNGEIHKRANLMKIGCGRNGNECEEVSTSNELPVGCDAVVVELGRDDDLQAKATSYVHMLFPLGQLGAGRHDREFYLYNVLSSFLQLVSRIRLAHFSTSPACLDGCFLLLMQRPTSSNSACQ